jgi:UDP-N-acetylglucosamine 2-epimerase (non-hydrolysing)
MSSRRSPGRLPVHPRTRQRLHDFGQLDVPRVRRREARRAVGYLDSIGLAEAAACVLTDSGGLQEETTFLRVPCLTLRPNTERPITISEGSNPPDDASGPARRPRAGPRTPRGGEAFPCPALWDGKASERVADALLSA